MGGCGHGLVNRLAVLRVRQSGQGLEAGFLGLAQNAQDRLVSLFSERFSLVLESLGFLVTLFARQVAIAEQFPPRLVQRLPLLIMARNRGLEFRLLLVCQFQLNRHPLRTHATDSTTFQLAESQATQLFGRDHLGQCGLGDLALPVKILSPLGLDLGLLGIVLGRLDPPAKLAVLLESSGPRFRPDLFDRVGLLIGQLQFFTKIPVPGQVEQTVPTSATSTSLSLRRVRVGGDNDQRQ